MTPPLNQMFYNLEFNVSDLEEIIAACKKKGLVSAYMTTLDFLSPQGNVTVFRPAKFKGEWDVGGNTRKRLDTAEVENQIKDIATKLRALADGLHKSVGDYTV